jgi:8-oxo-dGTP diphosphatase
MTEPRTIHVVAGIIADGNHYLIGRRAPHKASPGLWEFPGGKVEPGETSNSALYRELLEELDMTVTLQDPLLRSRTPAGPAIIDLECIRGTLIGQRPTQSTDHDILLWVTGSELINFQWCLPDVPAVTHLSTLNP